MMSAHILQHPICHAISEEPVLRNGEPSQLALCVSDFSQARLTNCIVAGEGFRRLTGSLAFPYSSSTSGLFQVLYAIEPVRRRPSSSCWLEAGEVDVSSFGRFPLT